MKRVLSLIVVLAMVLTLVPFSVFAEEASELPEYGLCDTMAMGAYTYTWTAPSDGTAEFTLGECIGYTVAITDKNEMELAINVDEYGGHSAQANVVAGDTFTIRVVVTEAEGAFVYVSVFCAEPLGSEGNPYTSAYGDLPVETPILTPGSDPVWMSFWFVGPDDQPFENLTVTGPVQVSYNGETYTADQETGNVTIPLEMDMSSGMPRPVATMGFTNLGRAAMVMALSFSSGSGDDELIEIGTMDSPADMEVMNVGEIYLSCSAELDADDEDGYWFQWTNDLEVSGIVSFSYISIYDPDTYMPIEGQLEVEVVNPDTFVSSGNTLHDSTADGAEILNDPLTTVRVPVGHTLKVHVYTEGEYDSEGNWVSPAANVTAQGAFITDEDEEIYISNNGKAFKAPIAGGDTVSYISSDMSGKAVVISSGSEEAMAEVSVQVLTKDMNDWEAEFEVQDVYTVNEDGVVEFDVPLGAEAKLVITNGYEYNANFVIEQIAPLGFMTNPEVIPAEGQYTVTTADGVEALYYLSYTAEATGFVTVTPLSATLVSDPSVDATNMVAIEIFDETGDWLIGSNSIYTEELVAEVAVEAGETILIRAYGINPRNMNIVGVEATLDICLTPMPAYFIREEADGSITTNYFDSIAEALEQAQEGETVVVNADSVEDTLVIKPGVTLDLGSYDVTAEFVIGLTGCMITAERYSNKADADYGMLIVPQDKLVMTGATVEKNGNNYVIPVWNGEDAYVLANAHINDYNAGYGLSVDQEAKTIDFAFTHVMGGSANNDFLKNGADDNALKIVIRLSWETENGVAYQDFVYNADFVGKVAGGGFNYTFKLTGYDVLNINVNNLTVTAMILTDCGIAPAGSVWNINGANG